MGLQGVGGLGFMVSGLGFMVYGFRFRIQGSGFMVSGLGFMVRVYVSNKGGHLGWRINTPVEGLIRSTQTRNQIICTTSIL